MLLSTCTEAGSFLSSPKLLPLLELYILFWTEEFSKILLESL